MAAGGDTSHHIMENEKCKICELTSEDDGDETTWSQCQCCHEYFHDVCAGLVDHDNSLDWICSECVQSEAMRQMEKQQRLIAAEAKKEAAKLELAKKEEMLKKMRAHILKEEMELERLRKEQQELKKEKMESENKKEEEKESNEEKKETIGGSEGTSKVLQLMEKQSKLMNRHYLLELPDFDGSADAWPLFIAQYRSTSEEGSFSSAENLTRLRKSLKGKARKSVEGLLSLPDNLDQVLEILEMSFGGPEVLVKSKLRLLKELASVNESRPSTVKSFYEFILNLQASLNNVGAASYVNGPQLLDTLVEKLPQNLQRSWIKHRIMKGRNDLDEFKNWYKPLYQCAVIQDCESSSSKPTQRVNAHVESSSSYKCPCCRSEEHKLPKCEKFKKFNVHRRWDFVKQGKWCFTCLAAKHFRSDCERKKICGVDSCPDDHHPLLHKKKFVKSDEKKPDKSESSKNYRKKEEPDEPETTAHVNGSFETVFKQLPVKLYNGEKCVTVWAFLDEGSGPTLLTEDVARDLNLSGPSSQMCLKWTDGHGQQKFNSQRLKMEIAGLESGKKYALSGVQTVPKLDLPMPFNLSELQKQYKHLSGLKMPDEPIKKPQLLIGLKHTKLMLPYKIKEGPWNAPVASLTKLGWSIYGKSCNDLNDTDDGFSCHLCECTENQEYIESLIKQFYTTDSFGVCVPDKLLKSNDEEQARKIFGETIKLKNNRYEIGLLWKTPDVKLPDNRAMAYRRLICFEQKLQKDPILKEAVVEKFNENIKKGYVRPAKQNEIEKFQGRKFYLPMFAVQNPHKPKKIRLVYDAAAKYQGVALNDVLLKGPDNQKSIFGVLLRVRRGKIVLGGDIREFYHQVEVKKEDQYCQLLLWRDVETEKPPQVFILNVLSFGGTNSSSTAIHVKDTNASRFKKKFPRAYEAITEGHYSDNLFDSVDTVEEAIELGKQIRHIHAQGGFEIRDWVSNESKVVEALGEKSSNPGTVNLNLGTENFEEKMLGLYWNVSNDCFTFKTSFVRADPEIMSKKKVPTKREVLRIVMSPFDPLGMIAIVIVAAKVLVQSLWRHGCGWDEPIPGEIFVAWKHWIDSLQQIENIRVPRWYSPILTSSTNIQLVLFSDSSEIAFAAVAYLRIEVDGQVSTSFVCAKTRVAPQKSLSIPRLELQGAVLATRLAMSVRNEINLPINRVIFWTDSQTGLSWIRSTHRRYSPFVSTRVGEILESTKVTDWRWVPGKQNVADDATKWDVIPKISDRWFTGPEFLRKPENEWPVEKNKVIATTEEERTIRFHAAHEEIINEYSALNSSKFSRWSSILRTVAFMYRFVHNSSWKIRQRKSNQSTSKLCGQFSAEELEAAKVWLYKKCQIESYADEIYDLKRGKTIMKSSKIYKLSPILDDNDILRVETRLDAAPLIFDENMRRPIILCGENAITQLIIDSVHRKFHHSSTETVINELRQVYWIPKIRVFVNRVISACCFCMIRKAMPQIPRMAKLPKQKLSPYLPPFTYTGMDYMGPFYVTVGRRNEKRWICVFTCMTMRAIHLEVACSLDTSSCVMCIRNFMNRHGRQHQISSDKATNFKSAEKELKSMVALIDWDEVMGETQSIDATSHQIKWHFIPPASPHFGGSWERMVRTVKNVLYIVLKSQKPRDETFRSAVIEVEAIVNSRPLNYTSSRDVYKPAITPNLLLRKSPHDPPNCNNLEAFSSRKQWVIAQAISQEFWRRWLLEYVPTIATRSKWYDAMKQNHSKLASWS